MTRFATPLLAALLLLATPMDGSASAQASHTTGSVTLQVFGDGMIGQNLGVGGGFTFGGANGLFEGQLMFGTAADRLSGTAYAADAATPAPDWLQSSAPAAIAAPAPFNQAFSATFIDFAAPNPFNVAVNQRSYSSNVAPNDDFVIVEYLINNGSNFAIAGAHVGFFADYDVNTATANLGNYDRDLRLLYVYDTAPPTTHFGTMLLDDIPVSGWDVDTGEGVNPTDAAIWTSMTTFDTVPTTPADRRTLLATGPHNIAAGGTLLVRFALVAGSDLADLQANAQAARSLNPVVAENGPAASGFELMPAAPNPSAGRTELRVSLDEPASVRLAVFDVLGREVALLLDGDHAAGSVRIPFDASALPAGLYVARLESAGSVQTQRITVVR